MPTYKQFKKFLRDKCWNERDYGEWIYDKLIYDFLVEEIKENKEPDWAIWKLGDTFIFPVEDKIELTEETKKLMCDFAYWYHNWLLNRERRSPEEELDKFLISK